ncbi:nuclear transport factor 2 family protein [Streptomyces sp. NPDC019990]|uniref:nuclear transport factor 2 family protein n=1 Tax=Streptomyces sp. NPDC019990 TaxID=3154693 RepID=UPI0033EC67BC
MPEHDPAVTAAIDGELALLDPQVRRSPERVAALLHPDFHEFGASGRHWSRAAIIAALAEPSDVESPAVVTSRMRGVRLAPDLVHLTFDTERDGRHAHRSSLWRRTDAGWLLYFHQATPFSERPE